MRQRSELVIRPDGSIIAPDLTDEWHALAPLTSLPWPWPRRPRVDLAARAGAALELAGPSCRLCARRCTVDRSRGERGACGLGAGLWLAPPRLLWGEEPELGRPGLALRPQGCGLRCAFCYQPDLLAAQRHAPYTATQPLDSRAVHLHVVGGNPDESLPWLLAWLAQQQDTRPIVWNTHAYLSTEQVALLDGVVEAVVADLKFGPGPCAEAVAGAADYWPQATQALLAFGNFGVPLIVRHVALPGHLACCAQPVVRWLRTNLPEARLNLLDQYEPWGSAWQVAGLDRTLSEAERACLTELREGASDDG